MSLRWTPEKKAVTHNPMGTKYIKTTRPSTINAISNNPAAPKNGSMSVPAVI